MADLSRTAAATALFLASTLLAHAQQPIQPLSGRPIPGLTAAELNRFELGKAAFEHVQSIAEGRGPIFNRESCLFCHGSPTTGGGSGIFVTRFGVAAAGPNPFDPLLALGGGLQQSNSILQQTSCIEVVPSQADVVIHRVSPPVFGFGLVEAILDADIQVREAFPPAGVSGRAHMMTPVETPLGPQRVGRFGWKAQIATILNFAGDASVEELGVTNRLFPLDNTANGVPTASGPCDSVADPEDGPDAQGFHKIDRMSDFIRLLAPPPQTPKSGMSGEAIFNSVGCNNCHVSTTYTTIPSVAEAALQQKPLKPYTDFLLHDIGTALGDGIVQGLANETEFRTPPLWGLGFRASNGLLHDARANGAGPEGNIDLAILAHGGEAGATVASYSVLSASDKLRLQQFLMSLGRGEFDFEYSSSGYNNTIDEVDWFFMRPSLTGPGSFFTPDAPAAVCDVDQDGDFDLRDIAALQRAFTGV